jgi:TonB family protein
VRGLLAGVGLVVGSVIAAEAIAADAAVRQDGQSQTGRIIEARDGDTVIVRDKDRVRVVKRTPGRVRIAVNQARGFVVVMLDKGADGRADWVYRFSIDKPYPLEAPWEGDAEVDEYFEPSRAGGGIGVVTSQGVIQFLSTMPGTEDRHAAPNSLAIVRTHGSSSGSVSDTFAAVEPYWLEGRENEYRSGAGAGYRASVSMKASSAPPPQSGSFSFGSGPTSNAPAPEQGFSGPRRIHRVDAVQPEAARTANVAGIVIVEVTVAVDGSVTNARVLRSMPLLDEAALVAVRQWRYEPARRAGQAVEHKMVEGVFVGPPGQEQPRP